MPIVALGSKKRSSVRPPTIGYCGNQRHRQRSRGAPRTSRGRQPSPSSCRRCASGQRDRVSDATRRRSDSGPGSHYRHMQHRYQAFFRRQARPPQMLVTLNVLVVRCTSFQRTSRTTDQMSPTVQQSLTPAGVLGSCFTLAVRVNAQFRSTFRFHERPPTSQRVRADFAYNWPTGVALVQRRARPGRALRQGRPNPTRRLPGLAQPGQSFSASRPESCSASVRMPRVPGRLPDGLSGDTGPLGGSLTPLTSAFVNCGCQSTRP